MPLAGIHHLFRGQSIRQFDRRELDSLRFLQLRCRYLRKPDTRFHMSAIAKSILRRSIAIWLFDFLACRHVQQEPRPAWDELSWRAELCHLRPTRLARSTFEIVWHIRTSFHLKPDMKPGSASVASGLR